MDDIDDATARALRATWFRYLDTIEPLRASLHAYCLRLTGDVWDAEDLIQDVLLKGFGMIGRGDLHGPGSPVANPRAYLFRCATHQWIDTQRRQARQRAWPVDPPPAAEPPPETARLAGEALLSAASPQARAAVILKDVFDFTLEEIADALRTTVGGVKSALRRGREALADQMAARPLARTGRPLRRRLPVARCRPADRRPHRDLLDRGPRCRRRPWPPGRLGRSQPRPREQPASGRLSRRDGHPVPGRQGPPLRRHPAGGG